MIELVLDGPPMGKQRVRLNKHQGRLFTPDRTLTYEARLAAEGQRVMDGRPLLTGALRVEIEAHIMIPVSKPKKWKERALKGLEYPTGKPDFDNIAKIACDALNLIVWVDDAAIVKGSFEKAYTDRPRLVLRVWEIEDKGVFG